MAWLLFVLAVGGGAALAGALIAARIATTGARILGLLGAGVAGALLGALVLHLGAWFEDSPGCTDCGEGILIEGALVIGNFIGWTVGVLAGAVGRRAYGAATPGTPSA